MGQRYAENVQHPKMDLGVLIDPTLAADSTGYTCTVVAGVAGRPGFGGRILYVTLNTDRIPFL